MVVRSSRGTKARATSAGKRTARTSSRPARATPRRREKPIPPIPVVRYNPPWRRTVLHFLRSMEWDQFYMRMGWVKESLRYWRRRRGWITIEEGVRMARATGVSLPSFFQRLAEETEADMKAEAARATETS